MPPINSVNDHHLSELFSLVFLIDEDLRICDPSDTARRHMPQLDDHPTLDAVFTSLRPRDIESFQDAMKSAGSLILMVSRDGRFAIRGQWFLKEQMGRQYLVFCGAPWVSWMVEHRLEKTLQLTDFSAQDVQLDILFYMTTEARMIADLENVNSALLGTKAELENAQKQKDAFFAQMSHEIRTPLNAVISALRLLHNKSLNDDARMLIDLAQESSDNLMHVVNYVLDVSKMDAEEKIEKHESVLLAKFADSVVDVVRPRALEKSIDLILDVDGDVDAQISTAPDLLRQVLLNLLNNAIKFTDDGAVKLSIKKTAEGLYFSVKDSGAGISEEQKDSVFEPYESRPVRGDYGSGLGLDICRRNVERLGGKIGLESTLGKGSCFWFVIPGNIPIMESSPVVQHPGKSLPETLYGNILLVDDNATNLLLETQILESIGLTVTGAESGKSAISLVFTQRFDLVLMDINMPDMDGHQTTTAIRKVMGKEELPIIALTAYASSEEAGKSMKSGMNGYLTKPIDVELLIEELEHWLKGKQKNGSESSLLDIEIIDTLISQIGGDGLKNVLIKFTEEVDLHISTLENNVSMQAVLRSLHILKSTSRSLGLDQSANIFAAMESKAKKGAAPDRVALAETRLLLKNSLHALEDYFSLQH
jgi:signal transduction histidine kinase/CheY-like chemotaxis protein